MTRMDAFLAALRDLCGHHNCRLQTPAGMRITVDFASDPDAECDDPLAEVTMVQELPEALSGIAGRARR